MKTRLISLSILFVSALFFKPSAAQTVDPWVISAASPDPANYYGVTVANGMIGIVSSPAALSGKRCSACRSL